jgi:hypothetical protein
MLDILTLAIPKLGVDAERCWAAIGGNLLVTDEVIQRVESGEPFRSAYRAVAAELKQGTLQTPPACARRSDSSSQLYRRNRQPRARQAAASAARLRDGDQQRADAVSAGTRDAARAAATTDRRDVAMNSRRALRLRKLTELVSSSASFAPKRKSARRSPPRAGRSLSRRSVATSPPCGCAKKVAATSVPTQRAVQAGGHRHCNRCSASPFSMLPPPETH